MQVIEEFIVHHFYPLCYVERPSKITVLIDMIMMICIGTLIILSLAFFWDTDEEEYS